MSLGEITGWATGGFGPGAGKRGKAPVCSADISILGAPDPLRDRADHGYKLM